MTERDVEYRQALERLVSFGPRGHLFRPVAPHDVALVESANAMRIPGTDPKSTLCWDCGPYWDSPWDATRTVAQYDHEAWEAWQEAKQLLESDNPSETEDQVDPTDDDSDSAVRQQDKEVDALLVIAARMATRLGWTPHSFQEAAHTAMVRRGREVISAATGDVNRTEKVDG